MSTLRTNLRTLLETRVEGIADMLRAENSTEDLTRYQSEPATAIPEVRAGYLMGMHDAYQTLLQEASPGLLSRTIEISAAGQAGPARA